MRRMSLPSHGSNNKDDVLLPPSGEGDSGSSGSNFRKLGVLHEPGAAAAAAYSQRLINWDGGGGLSDDRSSSSKRSGRVGGGGDSNNVGFGSKVRKMSMLFTSEKGRKLSGVWSHKKAGIDTDIYR